MSVVPFISEDRINDAWHSYATLAKRLTTDPQLLSDRAFNEDMARRHERWRILYLRSLKTLETA